MIIVHVRLYKKVKIRNKPFLSFLLFYRTFKKLMSYNAIKEEEICLEIVKNVIA